MEQNKDRILEKLSVLNLDQLDRLKDEKLVELRQVLKNYALARDEEMRKRYFKRTEYLKENSFSKTEQMLRADEELFLLKKKILALSALRASIKLEIELINSFYWKNKQ